MKKLGVFFFLASCASAVFAQVSVSGTIDLAMRREYNGVSNTFLLQREGANASKLVFQGREDLGGGLAAGFFLDSTVKADTGSSNTPFWDRRSTVSLYTRFGEFRLGRDDSLQNTVAGTFDALNGKGVGNVLNLATPFNFSATNTFTRVANAISYLTPDSLGGFSAQVQFAPGEGANSGNRLFAFGVGYLRGPFDIQFTQGRDASNQVASVNPLTGASTASIAPANYGTVTPNASGSWTYSSLGSSYDFGIVRLMGSIINFNSATALSGAGTRGEVMTNIGARVPVGGYGSINVAFTHANRYGLGSDGQNANQLALQYMHNLSKRTALYMTGSRLTQTQLATAVNSRYNIDGTDVVGRSGFGLDFGIRHRF